MEIDTIMSDIVSDKIDITTDICNICTDVINIDDLIVLKCNNSHVFCYDCIFSWYKLCEKNIGGYHEYIHRMCPICKKDGGLLPLKNDITPIKYIHQIPMCKQLGCTYECATDIQLKYKKPDGNCIKHYCELNSLCQFKHKYSNNICLNNIVNNDLFCNNHITQLVCYCNAPLKTKFGKCTNKGLTIYGGKCGLHKDKDISTINIDVSNICNSPLLSKPGLCKNKGSSKYNGKCYHHKNIIT